MKILLGIVLHFFVFMKGAHLKSTNFDGAMSDNHNRIISGVKVNIHSVPYVVSIKINYKDGTSNLCGGVLLGSNEILSAAHCFHQKRTKKYWKEAFIRAGSSYYNLEGSVRQVAKVYYHPLNNKSNQWLHYDLAFIIVRNAFPLNNSTRPVNLAEIAPDNGDKVVVLGWGETEPDWKPKVAGAADHLYAVNITVRDKKSCKTHSTFFLYSFFLSDNIVCIRDFDNNRRTICFGDSGSPVMYNNRLVGIVNGFIGFRRPKFEIKNDLKESTVTVGIDKAKCTDPFSVPIYTSIMKEKEWINKMMKKSQSPEMDRSSASYIWNLFLYFWTLFFPKLSLPYGY